MSGKNNFILQTRCGTCYNLSHSILDTRNPKWNRRGKEKEEKHGQIVKTFISRSSLHIGIKKYIIVVFTSEFLFSSQAAKLINVVKYKCF